MALFATLRSTIGENLKFTCSEAHQSLKHPVTAHYSVKTAEYGELIERIKGRERRFVPWKFRMLSTLWYLEL